MKKILLTTIILLLGVLAFKYIYENDEKESELVDVKVSEVTHSLFYAPWYVSIEEGYFKSEGLNVEFVLTPGADKVASSVLSNDVNIGFSGPEATIYVYNNNESDYLVTFASLTKRDGQFIVGPCEEKENFDVKNLEGKTVIGGRVGGMPLMVFNYGLSQTNVDLSKINIDTSVEFAALAGAYISGVGQYVNLFEPAALALEKAGQGCVLSSIGLMSGQVPYTAFYARKSYLENNIDTVKSFVKALNKGLTFVKENDAGVIAEKVIKQFPDISLSDATKIIERYKTADSWYDNTLVNKVDYQRLIDIMIYNEVLDNSVIDIEYLVDNSFN